MNGYNTSDSSKQMVMKKSGVKKIPSGTVSYISLPRITGILITIKM
jgi:hypothetical protein